jgi:hypothetical protein
LYNRYSSYIMFRAMVLNALALLLGTLFVGALTLLGFAVSITTGESGDNPIVFWIGAGICFLLDIIVLGLFIPAYRKQKRREEEDDKWNDLNRSNL